MVPGRFWDRLAAAGLVAALVLVIVTFRQYGITWDEEWQATYGRKILDWYMSGFADDSVFSYQNLYFYGGAFDLAATLLDRISPLGTYETRHLLGGMIGVLGLVGAWRLGRRLGGPRAGFLAGLLLFLVPGYWGHVFFNPKDPPFAVAMIWSLIWAVRIVDALPRPSLATTVAFGLVWGLALGSRIGAVLIAPYLGLVCLVWFVAAIRREGAAAALADSGRVLLVLLPGLVAAWCTMALVWPWAAQAPLNPLRALDTFAHFSWGGQVLSFGRQLAATELPWWYLPGQLLVQLPEVVLLGLAALPVVVAGLLRRAPYALGLVLLAAFFPILYFVLMTPPAYHGYRHFLFVVPPLAVLAGLGLDGTVAWLAARSRLAARAALVTLAGATALQASVMARLFPDEYIYFNSLVGGVAGAEGRFNLDYWGASLREAALSLDALAERDPEKPAGPRRVLVCGYPLSATYWLSPEFTATDTDSDAEFYVSFTESGCDRAIPGDVVATISRMGVPLAVVKDRRRLVAAAPPR